jgi:hypothetical protein
MTHDTPTRDEAIRILEEGHEAVLSLIEHLSDDDFVRPATIGGGDWSAKDLLGHLTFWKENAMRSLSQWRAGETYTLHEAYAEDYGADGVDGMNAADHEAKASLSASGIKTQAASVHAELIAALSGISDEEWGRPIADDTWGEELGSILGGPLGPFDHTSAHLEDLRTFVGSLA